MLTPKKQALVIEEGTMSQDAVQSGPTAWICAAGKETEDHITTCYRIE
jgi:hypothetical protein